MVPTGEQATIRAPSYCLYGAVLTGECPEVRAGGRVPEPNSVVVATTGQGSSIGSKGKALNLAGKPVCPEESTALHLPQFEGAIPATGGQGCPVGAESQGSYCVGMG